MQFTIRGMEYSVRSIEDLCGYTMMRLVVKKKAHQNEIDLVRNLNLGQYPRFRLTVEILNGGIQEHRFNLWLENSLNIANHQYSGLKVTEEIQRIKKLLT